MISLNSRNTLKYEYLRFSKDSIRLKVSDALFWGEEQKVNLKQSFSYLSLYTFSRKFCKLKLWLYSLTDFFFQNPPNLISKVWYNRSPINLKHSSKDLNNFTHYTYRDFLYLKIFIKIVPKQLPIKQTNIFFTKIPKNNSMKIFYLCISSCKSKC